MITFPFQGWMGQGITRGGTRAVLPVLVALALMAASPARLSVARKVYPSEQSLASAQCDPSTSTPVPVPDPCPAQPASPWLGTGVVMKSDAAALQGDVRPDGAYRRYHVDQVDGEYLWLNSPGMSGTWVRADQVVPLADADRYFSEQLHNKPSTGTGTATDTSPSPSTNKSSSVRSYNRRAMVRHDRRDYAGAIADYTEAIRHDPTRPSLFNNRAAAWLEKGDLDRAIADYTEAIRLDPNNATAHYGRALAWLGKQEFDKAIADADEAIRLRPTLTGAFINRGLAWLDKKEYDKAIADFDEAIRLDPDNPSAYNNRATAREARQQIDSALADYSEAVRRDPKYVRAYRNRGRLRESQRDYVGALADYDEVIRLDPKSASGYRHRAWIWATSPDPRLRDGKTAVKAATRACELTGWKDPASLGVLAAALAESGNFPEAVKYQTEAIRLLPEDSPDQALFRSRLELYQSGKPYHQEPAAP